MTTEKALVNSADIARLAGVGRAAVSNWRRRYEDFPQPAGGTAHSPLFALPEVEAWLANQGRRVQVSDEERLWQLIRSSTDDLQLGTMVGELGHLGGPASAGSTGPDTGPPPITAVPEHLVQAAQKLWVRDASATYEFLVRRFVEAHIRRVSTTPAHTAELMVRLINVTGRRVYDPACGIGTLLVAAERGGARRLVGQDRERYATDITFARLKLGAAGTVGPGADIGVQVATGDSLTSDGFADGRFDVGLCDPPFGDRAWGYDELTDDPRWVYGLPPRGESELAWVQHVLWHLVRGGEAAILMPPAAADRRSGRRIRSRLLRTGTLRAVIALPPGSAAGSTAAPHLWLLRCSTGKDGLPSHVLMMDASALDESELNDLVAGRWERFERRPDQDERSELSRAVPLIDLLDDTVDLTPARHLHKTPTAQIDFDAARDRFRDRLAAVGTAAAEVTSLTNGIGRQTMTTLGELIQNGTVTLLQAPPKMDVDTGNLPVLTANDIALGRPPSGYTTDTGALLMLQPGDVVLPVPARRAEVRVIGVEGMAAGPQVQVLRPDPHRCDPYFLACFLRAHRPTRASTTNSRAELRRVPLPRLPLAEQQSYGAAYRRFSQLSAALRDLTASAEEMITLGYDGLGGGGLRPEG